jgi:putative sigma-54 modulation protein
MRLELTGRHVTITPGLRTIVLQRLSYTLRMLNDSAVSAQVVLTKEKTRLHADVTLHARGEHFLHGEATGRDIPTALGAACDKIDQQARKLKGKWTQRKRRGISAAKAGSAAPRPERGGRGFSAEGDAERVEADGERPSAARGREAGPRIIRVRRYAVKPMSVEDAAAEIGDGNDAVIVFRNSASDAVTVLFRRPDGNFGLIEPEA